MAQRRMFSKEITTSDLFVDMPASTQLLYFHLGMEADDEGFIGNARMLGRAYGASNDDLKLLQAKGFIIVFESGVTVVKDWNLNNQIRKDRLKQTIYQTEKSLLTLDNTGVYQLDNQMTTKPQPNDNQMTTKPQPNDNQVTTKCPHRLGKDRIEEDRIEEDRIEEDSEDTPSLVIVSKTYQSKIGVIDGGQFQQLAEYVTEDGMEIDVVLKAISEAADNGKRNFKYILAILRNWKQNGIKTIVQVEERERQRIEQRASAYRGTQVGKESNVPIWSKPDYKEPEMTEEDKAELERIHQNLLDKLEKGTT